MAFNDQARGERESMMRMLKLLGECSTALVHAETEQHFLDAVCRLGVETGGYLMTSIGFAEPDGAMTVRAHAATEAGHLDLIEDGLAGHPAGHGTADMAIRTGRTLISNDISNDFSNHDGTRFALNLPGAAAVQPGYRSAVAIPLTNQHRAIGVLCAAASAPFSYDSAEVAVLEELAKNISHGIEAMRARAERESAQATLHKENEKSMSLLRNASDGIHVLDIAGNLIEASDAFCTMLGYSRDEMIGMNVAHWDAHFSASGLVHIVQQQLVNPGRSQFESTHRRKDGSIFDVEVSGTALELGGKPVLFNSSRDITERKQSDIKLRE